MSNRDEIRQKLSLRLESAMHAGVGIFLSKEEVCALLPESDRAEIASEKHCGIANLPIRWLIRRDMPDVLRIEQESYVEPWSEEDFLNALRQRNCIGMVCESEKRILGFMIYELFKDRIDVLKMAVEHQSRRLGVGTSMVDRLSAKLHNQRRRCAKLVVSDSDLHAHLFLKSCGFSARPAGDQIEFVLHSSSENV